MRKKTEKKSKVYPSKILYKAFRKGYHQNGPDGDWKKNFPPIGPYRSYEGNLGVFAVDNAKGFIPFKIWGKITPCENGFHAFERKDRAIWTAPEYGISQRVYKIRLFNCFKSKSKWVGDEFEVLERVTVRDLKPRRWRD